MVMKERPLVDRWAEKMRVGGDEECWVWAGAPNSNGYGKIGYGRRGENRQVLAHRLTFYLHYEVDPGTSMVMHSCNNRLCCNPRHLSLGLAAENNSYAASLGRIRGHGRIPHLDAGRVQLVRRLVAEGGQSAPIAEALNVPKHVVDDVRRGRSYRWVG